jgi:hypothetical protein
MVILAALQARHAVFAQARLCRAVRCRANRPGAFLMTGFHQQLDADDPAGNMVAGLRLAGPPGAGSG